MKFVSFTMKDGHVVVVNIAHVVALFEVGREPRLVLSSGDDFYVEMPLAQVRTQIENALGS